MKQIVKDLEEGKILSKEEAKAVVSEIASGKYSTPEIISFLQIYVDRPVTVDEFTGFRNAMYEKAIQMDFSDFGNTIDMCGTGGDGKNTFNISTLASFIVAGTGEKVVKHGNVGVSSNSGSSNVLEYLGYKFTNDESTLKKHLDATGFCYMHAPLFHPAMKYVGPARKEMGVKTFFNLLGPTLNPSNPKYQVVGIYHLSIADLYKGLFINLEKEFTLLHSLDGYDEISLTADTALVTKEGSQILSPIALGFKTIQQKDINGGETVEDAGKIFLQILQGEGNDAQNSVVIANAAMGIKTLHPAKSLAECNAIAKESLDSGKAFNTLKKISGR